MEQNLAAYRAYGHDQKANISHTHRRNSLKVLLDAPPVGHYRAGKYTLTPFGEKALQTYKKMFGGQSNAPASQLPRRQQSRRQPSKTGMQALLRIRNEENKALADDSRPMTPASLKRCSQLLETAAEEHATKKQKTLAASLAAKVESKLLLLSALSNESRQKHEAAVAKEDARLSKMQSMQQRDLKSAEVLPDSRHALVVCVITRATVTTDMDQKMKDVAAKLAKITAAPPKVTHITSSTLVAKVLEAKCVVWLGLNQNAEKMLLHQVSNEAPELCAAMIRLLGGYAAGPTWLNECCSRQCILTPCVRLAAALQTERQIGFDSTCGSTREALLKVMATVEAHPAGWRAWVVRAHRKDVCRVKDSMCFQFKNYDYSDE